jgi:phage tail protein X
MIQQYRTKEGESLDSICYNYYGTTSSGQVEATLEANRPLNLPAYGPELPAGLIITLPEVEAQVATTTSLF